MADTLSREATIEADGLRVSVDLEVHIASLRYFDADGVFAAAVRSVVGMALPGVLQAAMAPASSGAGALTLAWSSPTETLLIGVDGERFSNAVAALADAGEGCIVDQTGGFRVLRVCGERVLDLLARLGGSASAPKIGEGRRSRLADVTVLAICVRPDETLLIVDRVYAEHLLTWIRETAADFATP
jgi:heterotetrameric sarcosine oxidase gamma subunit